MPTYILTVIYKIICNDVNITDCYVGHTTNLKQRTIEHKYACSKETNKSYNFNVYQTIRANGGWNNWSIVKIEDYPCNCKQEAHSREQYWYHSLNAKLNMISPVLDEENALQNLKNWQLKKHNEAVERETKRKQEREQYLTDNAEAIKQKAYETRKAYVLKNRERINANMRAYNAEHKEELSDRNKKYRKARLAKTLIKE